RQRLGGVVVAALHRDDVGVTDADEALDVEVADEAATDDADTEAVHAGLRSSRGWLGWGCGGRAGAPAPRSLTEAPLAAVEREQGDEDEPVDDLAARRDDP